MSEIVNLVPSPESLVESLRSIGYSFETAVADIIDNSITAGATEINIRFGKNDENRWFAIVDNGCGMSKEALVDAMRFGCTNPRNVRAIHDLGRFGLGLKTASFSQCRKFMVLSKAGGKITGAEWDLQRLSKASDGNWDLAILTKDDLEQNNIVAELYDEHLENAMSGTIVLWQNLDRVISDIPAEKIDIHFNSKINSVRKHLELVFHRYLSPDPGHAKVEIRMNFDWLQAFNPFNPWHEATLELPKQLVRFESGAIKIQPYVLPHHNKISQDEYNFYSGQEGYLNNQGFYVYRNRRLIVKGTWFRLIKKTEMNKLIRVRVDIPNSLDYEWAIDVKKSYASPPAAIREALKQVIQKIESSGQRVYKQRGTRARRKVTEPVWDRTIAQNQIFYKINRNHFLIKDLLGKMPEDLRSNLVNFLALIETSFPKDMLFEDLASSPENFSEGQLNEQQLSDYLDVFFLHWKSGADSLRELMMVEPFVSQPELTRQILQKRGIAVG